jgi:hypothetical protein
MNHLGLMRQTVIGLLALLLCADAASHADESSGEYHRYIILGSGPSGLQMAHYLETAGRDFIMLEKGPEASQFFRQFPRFRTLISINKPNVGTDHLDYNLRHDWYALRANHSVSLHDRMYFLVGTCTTL